MKVDVMWIGLVQPTIKVKEHLKVVGCIGNQFSLIEGKLDVPTHAMALRVLDRTADTSYAEKTSFWRIDSAHKLAKRRVTL